MCSALYFLCTIVSLFFLYIYTRFGFCLIRGVCSNACCVKYSICVTLITGGALRHMLFVRFVKYISFFIKERVYFVSDAWYM